MLGSLGSKHPTMHNQLPSAVRGPCVHSLSASTDAWLTLSSCPERDVMHLQVQQLLFPGIPSAKGSGKMPMERTFKVSTGSCSYAACPSPFLKPIVLMGVPYS